MRFLIAAALLAGFSACPAAAQWDDDRPTARRGERYDDRRDPGLRFGDDDRRGDFDRRDRWDVERGDPDEIMPRRRDRDDRGRRDAEGRWRDDWSRADRYDRYGPSPYGPIGPQPVPGGVFVVPPPIPGSNRY